MVVTAQDDGVCLWVIGGATFNSVWKINFPKHVSVSKQNPLKETVIKIQLTVSVLSQFQSGSSSQ